jgi:DNA modification methylase
LNSQKFPDYLEKLKEFNNAKYPTQKPTKYFKHALMQVQRPDMVVCDPFLGSALVLLLPLKAGCKFVGTDISQKALDISKNRYSALYREWSKDILQRLSGCRQWPTLKENTKVLFGFTSPRTIEKIIPEIQLLARKFSGKKWVGNEKIQTAFFDELFKTDDYKSGKYPNNPALAARDRITRAPKALGFVFLDPDISLTAKVKNLLQVRHCYCIYEQLLKFQLTIPIS